MSGNNKKLKIKDFKGKIFNIPFNGQTTVKDLI